MFLSRVALSDGIRTNTVKGLPVDLVVQEVLVNLGHPKRETDCRKRVTFEASNKYLHIYQDVKGMKMSGLMVAVNTPTFNLLVYRNDETLTCTLFFIIFTFKLENVREKLCDCTCAIVLGDLLAWPGLLEAWLALTSVKYHGNLKVLIPLNQTVSTNLASSTGT